MLQLTFPHNFQLKASRVTPSSKPKVTRSQKRSAIVTSQVEVPKVKKRKEIKDSLQVSSWMCTLIYKGVNTTYCYMLIWLYYILLGI